MRSAIISMDVRYQKYMELGNQAEAEKYLLSDPDDESEYYSAQGFDDNIACICRESAFTFYEKVIDEIYLMYQEAGVELNKFGVALMNFHTVHGKNHQSVISSWKRT